MSFVVAYALAGAGTLLVVLWVMLYLRYSSQYDAMIAAIDKKQFFLPEIFFIGFGFMDMFKVNLKTEAGRKKEKKIAEIYGEKYAEYYHNCIVGGQITYALTVAPLGLFIGAMTNDMTFAILVVAAAAALIVYLDMEVSKLNMLRASHLSQRYALEELVLRKYPAEIKELNERIAGYEQDSARLAEHPKPAEGIAPMALNGVTYAERENAGKAIIHACTHMNGAETIPVGSYRGFDMALNYDSKTNEFHMTLKGSLSHTAVLGADAGGNVTRIDNVLEKIDERLESARSQLAHTSEQLENARTEMVAPFPKEAELAEKTRRLNELNVLLNLNEQDRPVMADEPDEGDRIPPKAAERER